ncbi:MAG: ComF family protein [Candidatus Aminicenantales bacterium]
MKFSLNKIFSRLEKIGELVFFPSFCQICRRLLEAPGERVVCRPCLERLKSRRSALCLCCGRFFEAAGESHLCQKCLQSPPPFSVHRSCAKYRKELKDFILLFKYRKFKVLGKELARFANQSLKREEKLWEGVEILIPVPLHARRKRQRGFNQAQVIAEELARLKNIPLEKRILVKIKNIPPQTSLEQEEREKNVRGAFRVNKREKIKGKIVLLIDDVYTTGSTLKECGHALLGEGAKEVRALTIAQA